LTKISASGKQHVQMYRKVLLRKRLLRWAEPGAVYVPFIGDGDISAILYDDRRIYGADLDPDRVAVARTRLSDAKVKVADCDGWPFMGLTDTIAVADFDAYVDPYKGFRCMWKYHEHFPDRVVLFFTDGRRQGLIRSGSWTKPDGTKVQLSKGSEKSTVFNTYLSKHIYPWFVSHIEPEWKVLDWMRYQRSMMLYWGAVIERVDV
jgi:hypothetical protein